jgi:hypothetical protein
MGNLILLRASNASGSPSVSVTLSQSEQIISTRQQAKATHITRFQVWLGQPQHCHRQLRMFTVFLKEGSEKIVRYVRWWASADLVTRCAKGGTQTESRNLQRLKAT